jgi:hypothetical protein
MEQTLFVYRYADRSPSFTYIFPILGLSGGLIHVCDVRQKEYLLTTLDTKTSLKSQNSTKLLKLGWSSDNKILASLHPSHVALWNVVPITAPGTDSSSGAKAILVIPATEKSTLIDFGWCPWLPNVLVTLTSEGLVQIWDTSCESGESEGMPTKGLFFAHFFSQNHWFPVYYYCQVVAEGGPL